MTFRLSSPPRPATKDREGKPETIVEVETDGIRERRPSEKVHLAFADEPMHCTSCSATLLYWSCWTDNSELHARHPARCSS